MYRKYIFILLIFSQVLVSKINAQKYSGGIPFLRNYSHEEYKGESQNFAVIQDDRGVMYFANNTSVLEFDGSGWRQIFIPGKPTIYSLGKSKSGRIYVGASKGELGYLYANEKGVMTYKSLRDKIPKTDKGDSFNYIREIVFTDDNKIIFVSSLQLFIYDGKKFTTINKEKSPDDLNRFVSSFKIGENLYIQERGKGLHRYKGNSSFEFVPGTEKFSSIWITGIFPTASDSLLFTTWSDKKYKFYNGKYSSDTLNSLLRSIYKNAKAKDSNYIMGLYDNGIVYTDDKLNIKKHISTTTGLQNNTIYSLFVDKHSNVWAGMSNGISIIHSNSPFSVYDNNFGLNGTTLSSVLFNNHLYIGNSTGVYQMNWKNRGPERKNEFSAIENKLGAFQIWQLENIDNQLVCSGTSGIFYIQNNKAEYIQENESVKSFIQLKYRPNTILTIGGNGLATITRKDSIWGNFEAVAGFKKDFRDIIQYSRNTFWASDRKKGIIKLSLTETLDSVNYKKSYGIKDGLPDDIGNQVLIINNKLIVATAEGVYRYDDKNDIFIPDEFFGETLGKTVKVTELIHDANNNIWFKQKVPDPKIPNKSNWILGLIKLLENDVEVEKTIFKKLKNNIHSINPITEHETLIGTEQGFVIYNNTKENPLEYDFNAIIRHIEIVKNDSVIFGGCFSDTTGIPMLKQNPKRIPILPYNYNDVRIYFSALFFEDPEQNKYKFILEGNDMQWSDWKTETKKEYSNLEPGQYTFRVIAKNLYNQESQEAVYTFEILPPYYRTVLAFIVYGILFILFIWGIVALSTHRVKKQKENLERIVEQRTQEIQKANIELNNRNEVIKRKNLDITSSINYAKRIQEAMLPIKDQIKQSFDDSFILFKPRDIVSGDFYWFEEKNDKVVIAAVDCTGHGVPGAFMSLIGSEILTTIVGKNIFDPKLILSKMNNYVVTALKQEATTNQDGMDMALCVVDKKTKTVEFAGAKNPLVYISNNEIHKIRGSRKGIGGYQEQAEFTSEVIEYQSPSYFYIFSDGFQDQFGGPKNRKFMIRKLRQLLFEIHKLPGKEQHQILDNAVENWKGIGQQTDDILLIGFKI